MRRVLLGLAIVVGLVGLHPSPATAACGGPLATSGDLVFVGTAVATTNAGRFARFAVEEVWSGDASLAPGGEVTIVGGPDWPDFGDDEQTFVAMEHEHLYERGGRYLVVATNDRQWETMAPAGETEYPPGALTDGACTISAPWTDELAQLRPADATFVDRLSPIETEPWTTDNSPPYVMIALTTILVAGGCLYLLFRRGSIAYRARQDDDGGSRE
jgi:hypothetical protein